MNTMSELFGTTEKIELFFIGEDFYNKSQTVMGNLYVSGNYERFDWGFVKCLLREGKSVTIYIIHNIFVDNYFLKNANTII